MVNHRNALPDGTILNSRYKIERFIGGGGFGLVYQAKHIHLDLAVAIKELLPSNIATREGSEVHPISSDSEGIYQQTLSSFRKEGKRLVQLINCEHIVRCSDYFEENNTGYLVMDYVEGTPLTSFIESYKEEGQSFSQAEIVSWLEDLLSGLKQVHKKGILHLDIKPGNIFIRRKDERPILLDFGASKSTTGHSTSSGLLIGTPPYAPFEQMQKNGNRGPWSDIYALGMLMYQLVFGDDIEELPSSSDRIGEDRLKSAKSRGRSGYSDGFLALIDKCVSREIKERPQSIEEMEALLSSTEGKMKPERKQERVQEEKGLRSSYKKWAIFKVGKLFAVGIAVMFLIGIVLIIGDNIHSRMLINSLIAEAEQGDAFAQWKLGFAYEFAEGVNQDYAEAVRWYRKAAEQGDAAAQDDLGDAYWEGKGVDQDYAGAVRWYRKAAEQGDRFASGKLSNAYYHGKGVTADKREAYIWYSIDKVNGIGWNFDEAVRNTDWNSYLSQEEIRSADKEVARRIEAFQNGGE